MAKLKKVDLLFLYNEQIEDLKYACEKHNEAVQTIAMVKAHTYVGLLYKFYALTDDERFHLDRLTKISMK